MRRAAIPLALLLVAGCGGPPPSRPFVLRVGVNTPLHWEGPQTSSGGAMMATDLVYETFLSPSGDGFASPFLRRWESREEGRWRLEFESARRFSDGLPVTAAEVARSLAAAGFRVERAGNAIVAESPAGAGGLADLLLGPVAKGDGAGALGTGPFAVAERSEQRLVLRRLEPRRGGIATVELVAFPSTREAFAQLLRGQLNAVSPLERGQAELLEGVPGVRVLTGRGPNATTAFLNPRRLSLAERRALVASVPVAEVAERAGLGAHCTAPRPERAVPDGRPLRIGYLAPWEENLRAALALRRALGRRGGEVVRVASDEGRARDSDLDILVKPALIWPTAMLSITLAAGARFNPFGYANPAFEAALGRGDEAGAAAALREDPAMMVICRRQRFMAVDARIRNANLSEWGVLDTLPDWEVEP